MRKFLAILFVLVLISPAAAWILGLDFGMNINRLGLKFPLPYGRAFLDKEYYRALDHFINDSFSLRGPLILVKNWIDLNLFRTTDTNDVHIGRHGWLYSRKSVADYQPADSEKDADMERLVLQLHAIEKIVTASDRRFVFVVAPSKALVYPEYLGLAAGFIDNGRSQYDLLLEHLERHPLKSFIRLDDIITAAKRSQALLYDRQHAHWNGLGASVAAENIYHRIHGDVADPGELNYISTHDHQVGDLGARLMGLTPEFAEKPFRRLAGSGRPDLPSGILYGDLFRHNLIPYLLQMFNRLDIVQADRIPSVQHKEDWLAYDYILLEIAQTGLQALNIDLDRIYTVLASRAQIARRLELDLKSVVPISLTSLHHHPGGLEIKSLGAESAFDLNEVPASEQHIFRVLKLSFAARQSDRVRIHYHSPLRNAAVKSIKPGNNEIFLPLPFQKTVAIRIYPGDRAGLIDLRSAEVIEFSDRPEPGIQSLKDMTAEKEPPEALPYHLKVAEADPDFTERSEIPPVQDPVHEGGYLKDSPQEKSDAAAAIIPDNGRPSTAVAPPAETEVAFIASKPDKDAARAGEKKGANDVISIVLAKVGKDAPNPPSIKLTDFEEGRIFQRRNGRADIVVSGTFRGSVDAVEARVVGADDFEEIVPWTLIDDSPRNGIFVGVLSDVPQGGWYHLQVRLPHTVSISDKGTHKWGVGMLIACLGQSNMKEWFHTGESFTAHPLIRKYSDKGWTVPGFRGNGALAFSNRLARILGIPIGLMDFAVNGSGLGKEADWGTGYWEDRSAGSIYSRFVDGVSRIGGALEFVIWFQGEADAARKTVTEREYRTSLKSFITNQVRADIVNSSDRKHLPFLIIAMTRRPGGQNKSHQAIRNAQKLVADNVAECYLAATTLDLKNRGKQHMQPGAYTIMGRRVAQTVLYVLGQARYYRGPTATSARQINDRRIDISIEHRGGTDFKPASGITGWQILANKKTLPIAEVKRHDPSTISIILEDPLTESATVRYLHGAMPDARHPVVDNSALALPLESYQSKVQ